VTTNTERVGPRPARPSAAVAPASTLSEDPWVRRHRWRPPTAQGGPPRRQPLRDDRPVSERTGRAPGSAVREIDDGDRPVGVVQDLPAHRPQQDPADQALAVGADDDQLRIAGLAQDRVGGPALHRDVVHAR